MFLLSFTFTIMYSVLTVMSNITDQDVVLERITCFISSSSLVGTRFFFGDAPITFFGPGTLLGCVCRL